MNGIPLPAACPEFLLAVTAVRRPLVPEDIQAALAARLDWNNFLAVVDKHRIAGLVWEGLSKHCPFLPLSVQKGLQERSTTIALQSVAMTREACLLSQQLAGENITAAVLKGPTLSTLAYGDIRRRQFRDIDLLIQRQQTAEAHAVLTARGYRLADEQTPDEASLSLYMRRQKHLAYVHRTSAMHVELHWRFQDVGRAGGLEINPEQWQSVAVGYGFELRTLPDPDLLLYLCLHGASHGWFRLKWLADVAALLHRSVCDTDQLWVRAEQVGAQRAVTQALWLSTFLFGTAPLRRKPDWAERWLVQEAWNAMTRQRASTEPFHERFASTRVRLSQCLLSLDPRDLAKQVHFALFADGNGPSRVSRSLRRTPLEKVVQWIRRKAR